MLPKPVHDSLNSLLASLKETEEYARLTEARSAVDSNDTLKALFREYRQLGIRIRAGQLNGKTDEEAMRKLESIGTLLNDDPEGMALLLAEYRMNEMMAEVYRKMAEATGADLGIFED